MTTSVVCRACSARLRVPTGSATKRARCPRCNARVNLAAELEATAYMPALTDTPTHALPLKASDSKPAARPHARAIEHPPAPSRHDDATLSLDDEDDTPSPSRPPAYAPPVAPLPAGPPPFRTPARVVADSARQFTGPCEVVIVPHGLFLEAVPYRPFLYAPVGSPVDTRGRRDLTVFLADGRSVTVEFDGGSRLAADAAAFLAGARAMPNPREYGGTPRWLLWAGLGLAVAAVAAVAFLLGRSQ